MSLSNPITSVRAAVPHASNPISAGAPRALYCSVAGNLVCSFDGGVSEVTIPLAANTWHPIRPTHIRATSTATVLLGY